MRHRVRLDHRGKHKYAGDERHQPQSFGDPKGTPSLQEPSARSEREPSPLKRQLRDVGQQRRAIGAECDPHRKDIDKDARQQNAVRDTRGEAKAVSSQHTEQQRPASDRDVVGGQGEDVPDQRRRVAVGRQRECEQVTGGERERSPDECDDRPWRQRRYPNRGVGVQPRRSETRRQPPTLGLPRGCSQFSGDHWLTA